MIDRRRFNISDEAGRLLCPACGFPGYSEEPAYDQTGGIIGTTICPCCIWEPGFDDDAGASQDAGSSVIESLRQYRERWTMNHEWRGLKSRQPAHWKPEEQLENLLASEPWLR